MKKILQPIIYLLTTIGTMVFIIGTWVVVDLSHVHIFWHKDGVIIALLIFFICAISGLSIGNYLIHKMYDKRESAIKKHLRESSIFYALFIYQISQGFDHMRFFSINCRIDCDDFIPAALISLVPVLAIIANAIYVFFIRKKNTL